MDLRKTEHGSKLKYLLALIMVTIWYSEDRVKTVRTVALLETFT
jgi:hypothetical protein